MQGIGPGSILGGRYAADRRMAQYAGAERWTARDTTLDRAVLLFTVPRSHPNVDAVLDAARRTAGLDNARLSRILDVGADDNVAYVVEEFLEGSHSLAGLLAAGALPAPEVRRIAGETALVLDLARNRGLHHQRLTPDLVMRTADGDVKVRGLATMAALAGVDDVDDRTAARADAMAVVAIAYAGFTGHWPLPGGGGGLPPAPRVASHVAAPSEIAVGVPADLDALCRLTFASDQGPLTPGDFARQIAPWSPIPVLLPTLDYPEPSDLSHSGGPARRPFAGDGRSHGERGDSPAPGEVGSDDDDDAGRGSLVADAPDGTGAGDGAQGEERPSSGQDRAAAERDADRAVVDRAGADAGAADADVAEGAKGGDKKSGDNKGGDKKSAAAGAGGFGQAPAVGKDGAAIPVAHRIPGPHERAGGGPAGHPRGTGAPRPPQPRPRPSSGTPSGVPAKKTPAGTPRPLLPLPPVSGAAKPPGAAKAPSAPPAQPAGPSQIAGLTAATTAALGSAGAATASAAKAVSGRLTAWSSATRDRAREAVGDARARREDAAAARGADAPPTPPQPGPARSGPGPMGSVAPGVGGYDPDALDTPVPFLPASAAQPLTREQSRMAIGIVVGFLLIVLLLAVWGLQRALPDIPALSSTSSGPSATGTPTPGAETTTETDTDTDTDGTPDPPAAGAPLTFTAASDYDPLGDGAERPEDLANLLDGDDETAWASEGYRTATFSGLKPGLGVVLDLGEPTSVSEVTLELPSQSVGRLYVTDDEAYAGGDEPLSEDLAEAGTFDGSGTVTTALADGASGRYVIVWFTEISDGGEQWFRARLAGASATS